MSTNASTWRPLLCKHNHCSFGIEKREKNNSRKNRRISCIACGVRMFIPFDTFFWSRHRGDDLHARHGTNAVQSLAAFPYVCARVRHPSHPFHPLILFFVLCSLFFVSPLLTQQCPALRFENCPDKTSIVFLVLQVGLWRCRWQCVHERTQF